MTWQETLTVADTGTVIESLTITGKPDETSKTTWMATVQNGLLIAADNITINHLRLENLHVGVEIRGANVEIKSWSADKLSGDFIQGDCQHPQVFNGRVTNALAVFPYAKYHPDITHFRGGNGGVIDGIEVVPSNHPWARKNYQGSMFSNNVFLGWKVRNLNYPSVHREHAVTFAEAHGCTVENIKGGGAVRFRSLNGVKSTGCCVRNVDGHTEGGVEMYNKIMKSPVQDESSFDDLLLDAAARLSVEPELLEALAEQEGLRRPFHNGRPTILFECHVFTQLLNNMEVDVMQLLKQRPEIADIVSYERYKKHGSYDKQWERFQLAFQVKQEAAIGGCSWGTYSVMGYHWEKLGYASANELMRDAYSLDGQFRLLVGYLERVEPDALLALRARDWITFKTLYNGPAKNDYAAELAQRYRRILARKSPKKTLQKGRSRTVNAQSVDVAAKAVGGTAVITMGGEAVKVMRDQVAQVKALQEDVSDLTGAVDSLAWMPWVMGVFMLVLMWPNLRSLYAYLHDNGYIGNNNNNIRSEQ